MLDKLFPESLISKANLIATRNCDHQIETHTHEHIATVASERIETERNKSGSRTKAREAEREREIDRDKPRDNLINSVSDNFSSSLEPVSGVVSQTWGRRRMLLIDKAADRGDAIESESRSETILLMPVTQWIRARRGSKIESHLVLKAQRALASLGIARD